MAQVVATGKVKLDSGQIVNASELGWYDGQQYAQGTLSAPGQINSRSPQQGAGQMVSPEVNRQSAAAQGVSPQNFEAYLQRQRQSQGVASPSAPGEMPGVLGASASASPSFSGTGEGVGFTAPTPLDLPGLYNTLSKNAGISDLEQGLYDKSVAFSEEQKKINNNPWLSEATRTGRLQKLSLDYNNNIKNDQDRLAMRKADIETQLNLQSKQFEINSQAAKDALDRFNVLLQSGALDGANGDDIANITRATGLSSSAIQSAVSANRAKNVQTSVVSYDDGTNQGFAVINTKTGEIINRQVVAASKPSGGTGAEKFGSPEFKATSISALNTFVSSKANSYGHLSPQNWQAALQAFLADGLGGKDDFVKSFGSYADPNRGDFNKAYGFERPI